MIQIASEQHQLLKVWIQSRLQKFYSKRVWYWKWIYIPAVLMKWIQEILLLYLCLRTLNSNFQMVMILQVLGVPYKCVSFVLEDANLLNGTKMCECLLQQLLWKATGNAATVHGAIGRTRLVIHFIKRQRLWITWKAQNVIRQLGISILSPVLVLFGDLPVFSLLGLFIDYIFLKLTTISMTWWPPHSSALLS